jgi:hypothetical protein
MKYMLQLMLTLVISLLLGALLDGARAAEHHSARRVKKTAAYGGEALKPKTNLKMDGRSVEALHAGKYDSLSIGDEGAKGANRLYGLPANFSYRAADSETEMRYRQ